MAFSLLKSNAMIGKDLNRMDKYYLPRKENTCMTRDGVGLPWWRSG